jgi:uncharacterized protein (TIGR03085 family)
MQRHALDERYELADTLRAAGPTAPTLCAPWRTGELTAHLVRRERSIVEMAGRVPVPALRLRAETALTDYLETAGYEQAVDEFAAGPPHWSPWGFGPVRETVNLVEYTVHHEDVRRAAPQWEPRLLPIARQLALWSRLRLAAPVTLRSVPVGVELVWPGRGTVASRRARHGDPVVTVTGEPVELVLVAFGRQRVARVAYDGRPDEIDTVRGARIAI